MGYAVELYLDEACEQTIRALWDALAAANLGDDLGSLGFRPHVTLSICEALDEAAFRPELERWAAAELPLPISFSALGIFPGDILFLAPAVTPPLLKAHSQLHRAIAPHAEQLSPLYTPGRWVPHCTLTMNLRPDERAGALGAVLDDLQLPIAGQLSAADISSYKPDASRLRQLLS